MIGSSLIARLYHAAPGEILDEVDLGDNLVQCNLASPKLLRRRRFSRKATLSSTAE
jgi:hypothetical protein